eukprot:scaffold266779_cov50-Prasinocladus_malaysianus.AAC.1
MERTTIRATSTGCFAIRAKGLKKRSIPAVPALSMVVAKTLIADGSTKMICSDTTVVASIEVGKDVRRYDSLLGRSSAWVVSCLSRTPSLRDLTIRLTLDLYK